MNQSITILVVALGGAIGSVSRYQVTVWFTRWFGSGFPYATLTVNVVGSFLMGAIFSALQQQTLLSPYWRPIISIGFLGALTTYSTFSIDTLLLFTQGEWLKALLNIALNVLLCLLAVTSGYLLLGRGA